MEVLSPNAPHASPLPVDTSCRITRQNDTYIGGGITRLLFDFDSFTSILPPLPPFSKHSPNAAHTKHQFTVLCFYLLLFAPFFSSFFVIFPFSADCPNKKIPSRPLHLPLGPSSPPIPAVNMWYNNKLQHDY